MQHGRRLYVGESTRTNTTAIRELAALLERFDFEIQPVKVSGCLHLSTGASLVGPNPVLANPEWIDVRQFRDCDVITVPRAEPWSANTILVNETVLVPDAFPRTRERLEQCSLTVDAIDLSEFMKAEGGPTCLTIIMDVNRSGDVGAPHPRR